ncbi:12228_t:CDS:2 [Entrophospora sp. SA101]|nr:12228_t:CDS:2 [Entrophospora sp. SA101]
MFEIDIATVMFTTVNLVVLLDYLVNILMEWLYPRVDEEFPSLSEINTLNTLFAFIIERPNCNVSSDIKSNYDVSSAIKSNCDVDVKSNCDVSSNDESNCDASSDGESNYDADDESNCDASSDGESNYDADDESNYNVSSNDESEVDDEPNLENILIMMEDAQFDPKIITDSVITIKQHDKELLSLSSILSAIDAEMLQVTKKLEALSFDDTENIQPLKSSSKKLKADSNNPNDNNVQGSNYQKDNNKDNWLKIAFESELKNTSESSASLNNEDNWLRIAFDSELKNISESSTSLNNNICDSNNPNGENEDNWLKTFESELKNTSESSTSLNNNIWDSNNPSGESEITFESELKNIIDDNNVVSISIPI